MTFFHCPYIHNHRAQYPKNKQTFACQSISWKISSGLMWRLEIVVHDIVDITWAKARIMYKWIAAESEL